MAVLGSYRLTFVPMNLQAPERIENYIAGGMQAPLNGHYIDNVNPATGAVYGQIPDSDSKDIEEAVGAAKAAFPGWSTTPAEERFKVLNRIAELIDGAELYSRIEEKENGDLYTELVHTRAANLQLNSSRHFLQAL